MKQDAKPSDEELVRRLLTVHGADDLDAAERADLEDFLRKDRDLYKMRLPRMASADAGLSPQQLRQRRELLEDILVTIATLRKQWQQVADGTKQEIARDGWFRIHAGHQRPTLDEEYRYLALTDLKLPEMMLEVLALNIQHHRDVTKAEAHKRPLRKLLIEPFFILLHGRGLLKDDPPKEHEIKMKALFDWVGVEQKYRPTTASTRKVAQEIIARFKAYPFPKRD